MGSLRKMDKLDRDVYVEVNNTLTSGITKADPSKPISEILDFYVDGRDAVLYLRVNELQKAIASDADLGFGEHIFTYPSGLGLVLPGPTSYLMTGSCPTGLSATAGEIGLGSTIASGAVAVLTGTAGFHNVAEAQTIADHVAATPLTIEEIAWPDVPFAGGQTVPADVRDASAADVNVHFNIASAWNQTSAETYTFSVDIVHHFKVLSSNFGVL